MNRESGQKKEPGRGRVVFIGAGPGDPELITVKGRRLLQEADLVVYAGSLVPPQLVACARKGAAVHDSSSMTLEQSHALLRDAARRGELAARVHTGDPMLYGAVREQMALLDADGIDYEVVPGVSALFAAAAAARISLTVPGTAQSLAVTRMDGRTPVPEGQRPGDYAAHGGSLAVYLSGAMPEQLAGELRRSGLGGDCPILMAYRVGWPDERLVFTTLKNLERDAARENFGRQVLYLALPGERPGAASDATPGATPNTAPNTAPDAAQGAISGAVQGAISGAARDTAARSRLYDKSFSHGFRKAEKKDRTQDE